MSRNYLLTALVAVLPTSALAEDALSTFQLGTQFCRLVQQGEQLIPIETLLSTALAGDVSAALAKNDEIQSQAPDEKPPLGDGIPWASWPDRPDTCTIGAAAVNGDHATLPIAYGFTNAPDAAYSDTLVLVRQEGVWRVDDVILIDDQQLRTLLQTAFQP